MFVRFADLDLSDLARRIVALDLRQRQWMAEWLELVAEFDGRGAARRSGFSTTSEWLAWTCKIDKRTARDHVRVARRLTELPKVAEAFGTGRLSYAQVRAVTRADPGESETALLEVALASTASQLERHVRELRSAASADLDVANAAHARRSLKYFWDHEDGSLKYFGRLGPVEGAAFIDAVQTAAEKLAGPTDDACACSEIPGSPVGARRADALVELVTGGGIETTVMLHVDPEALACTARGDEPRAGAICSLRDGPAIPSELARRLTCDAMVTVAGLNHGRTVRDPTPAQRRALEARDGRICTMPGCTRTHGLQAHHMHHWTRGGPTDLDNLKLVCRFHHRLFHDDGWEMRRRRDGSIEIQDPRGRLIYELPSRGSPVRVAA